MSIKLITKISKKWEIAEKTFGDWLSCGWSSVLCVTVDILLVFQTVIQTPGAAELVDCLLTGWKLCLNTWVRNSTISRSQLFSTKFRGVGTREIWWPQNSILLECLVFHLRKEAAVSFETFMTIYQIARLRILEDNNSNMCCHVTHLLHNVITCFTVQ